jgi:endonuclease YncB( thermonuclease family)
VIARAVLLAAVLAGLSLGLAGVSDTAAGEACALSAGGTATVAAVVDGDTLSLADGRVLRLAGIEAPKPFLVRPGADVAALAEASRHELERLAGGARLELRLGAERYDRHGRMLAEVRLGDGSSLQEALVAGGFARVRPPAGNTSCLGPLLLLEQEARRRKFGLWRSPEFGVIRADDPSLIERKGLYVFVEGRVVSVGRGNRLDFLNFGRNWRRDFTAMVGVPVSALMAENGLAISTLSGRRVLVRGVVEEGGGPAMRLSDPSEIEILDDE